MDRRVPRVLSILMIGFVSIFALDVFNEPNWPVALLIHLIPSFILGIFTAIAWRNGRVGGGLIAVAGVFVGVATKMHAAVIAIPLMVIGVMFGLAKENK